MGGRAAVGLVVVLASAASAHGATRVDRAIPDVIRVLTVATTSECAPYEDRLSLARAEAARIWAPAGVEIRWVPASALPYRSPLSEWVVVRCTAQRVTPSSMDSRMRTIASIRFVGSIPTNTILLSLGNADALLRQADRNARDMDDRFLSFRITRLGRMLGRAIAHEIGHFLSASGEHTATGLMRATHLLEALVGSSLEPFTVERLPMTRQARAMDETMDR